MGPSRLDGSANQAGISEESVFSWALAILARPNTQIPISIPDPFNAAAPFGISFP